MSYIKQFVIAVVLVLVMILAVKLQIEINELRDNNQRLQQEYDEMKYEYDKMKNQLEEPIDDEYIGKVASEKLDLKYNEYQYFYSDSPN